MAATKDRRRLRAITAHHTVPPPLALRVYRHFDWTALLIRGELDLDGVERVLDAAARELAVGSPLVIELAGLDFIDVNGVRALKRVLADGAALVPAVPVELHGARGQVADLIRKVDLDALLGTGGVSTQRMLESTRSRGAAA